MNNHAVMISVAINIYKMERYLRNMLESIL